MESLGKCIALALNTLQLLFGWLLLKSMRVSGERDGKQICGPYEKTPPERGFLDAALSLSWLAARPPLVGS